MNEQTKVRFVKEERKSMRSRFDYGGKVQFGKRLKHPLEGLTPPQKEVASYWLGVFFKRWERDLPPWRKGILVTRARYLATHVRDSAWARRCFHIRMAKLRNRRYGNPMSNPWARLKAHRSHQRRIRKKKLAELGLDIPRISYGNLNGI